MPLRFFFLAAGLALATWGLPRLGAASPPSAAVSVAGHFLPLARVRDAIRSCHDNVPQMSLRDCVDRYWVPRWVLDAHARAQGLATTPAMAHQKADLLQQELTAQIRRSVPKVTAQQEQTYLQQHQRDFDKPLRVRIFRILVNTRKEAQALLDQLSADTTLSTFRQLARQHSVDRATHERGGDLGFVWPDGSTDIPQVRAAPGLYQAVEHLTDGEFAPTPVAEGKRFAVVWRRGHLSKQHLDEIVTRRLVEARLRESRANDELQALLNSLAAKRVQARNDELLGKLRRKETTLFAR